MRRPAALDGPGVGGSCKACREGGVWVLDASGRLRAASPTNLAVYNAWLLLDSWATALPVSALCRTCGGACLYISLCRVEAAVAEAGVGMLLCGFGVAVSQYGVAHSWPGSLLTVCACVLRPTCRVLHVCTSSWQAASGVSAFMGGSLAPSCLNRSFPNTCAPMPHAGLTVASRRQTGSRWPLRRAVRPPRAPKWSTSPSRFINIYHTTGRQAGRQAGRQIDRQTLKR